VRPSYLVPIPRIAPCHSNENLLAAGCLSASASITALAFLSNLSLLSPLRKNHLRPRNHFTAHKKEQKIPSIHTTTTTVSAASKKNKSYKDSTTGCHSSRSSCHFIKSRPRRGSRGCLKHVCLSVCVPFSSSQLGLSFVLDPGLKMWTRTGQIEQRHR